jgi:transposase-like protein
VLLKHLNGQRGQEYAPMDEHSKPGAGGVMGVAGSIGGTGSAGARDALTEVLRRGAVDLLANAVRAEVAAWIDEHAHLVDEHGRRRVVRNGSMPEREIVTGIGPVRVKQPRVHDRRTPDEGRETFTSAILPPYLRKTRSMEDLIPWLYLKGVSTGDFSEALAALIGTDTPGFSATTVTRLKESWEAEYKTWSTRDLTGKNYVYIWADGVHFNIRLGEQDRQCILVLMGATAEGTKELIGVADGFRESEQCWKELLLDVKSRGLSIDPKLAIGDGALGFWKALPQVFTTTRAQRCWMHKTGNVLNKLPKRLHGAAKDLLHQVWMAPTKAAAEQSFELFIRTYEPKYPGAVECLAKDREALLAFYDFPSEHWLHLRTTNAIESVFATVRLRTQKTKGPGSRVACLTMVFKLTESASKKWRCLNGSELIRDVIAGVVFVDGVKDQQPQMAAA